MRLVYVSPIPWCSFTQRPHAFVDYFHHTTGGEVLWLNPYPTRLPSLTDFCRPKGHKGDFERSIPAWLSVVSPKALPIEPLPVLSRCNRWGWHSIERQVRHFSDSKKTWLAIGKPSVLALRLLNILQGARSLYDAMDDFPAFYQGISRWSMAQCERTVAQHADVIITSASVLVDKFSKHLPYPLLVHNACRSDLPPLQTLPRQRDRPVIGYVGTLGSWFDWHLLAHLARARPDCDFRLIGPLFSPVQDELLPNVFILPPLEHTEALSAMQTFDVGLIPFKLNRLTASVDPIKYYEYRAMGLPVLSSGFGEMALRKSEAGVFLCSTDNGGEIIDRALQNQETPAIIEQFRANHSWEARFATARLFM